MSTSQESITPQNETTSKPESEDAKTSKQDSDPHLQEKTPSENEATSKTKHDLAADAETPVQESTSVGNETASKDSSPPKITATHEEESITPQNETASKPESNDAKTSKQDSDPHSQEKTPSENETTPKTKDDLVPDAETPVQESTSVENETAFKDSSPPKIAATPEKESITPQNETTSKPESSDAKTSKQDSDPHSPEKTPSENETTSNTKDDLVADAEAPIQESTTVENEAAKRDDDKSRKEKPAEDRKKIPMWRKCINLVIRTRKESLLKSPPGGKDPIPQSDPKVLLNSIQPSVGSEDHTPQSDRKALPNLIKADVEYIEKGAKNLEEYGDQLNSVHERASNAFEHLKENGDNNDLTEMRKAMMKLKLQIPTKLQPKKNQRELEKIVQLGSKVKQTIADRALGMMPQLYNNGVFESSIEFKDFEVRYNMLSLKLKLCLLCFSIFPEKAIIKKRLMLQWWVAEGFVREDDANKCFMKLITKGFIEPVVNNKSLDVGLCQMHPFHRSALITLAGRAKFFNFDKKGMPTQNFKKSLQACLVGEGLISYEDYVEKKDLENANEHTLGKNISIDDLEKIHLLMNVNEQTLDFKPQWFSKMMNVNLLYLGRWSALPTDHIEVEDAKFLEKLVNMQYMKFLSLQGVSNIISLPDSISQLKNVKILDLRACYNLEILPGDIGLLKSLTHLDMSECYLLNHMPKSLSSLIRLKVLKGFVIGRDQGKSSCGLGDLKKLKNLIKLCIYTGLEKFPDKDHVRALESLTGLKKLTITWGRDTVRAENGDGKHEKEKMEPPTDSTSNDSKQTAKLPSKLEKLDLKCFPMSKTPSWLEPKNLKHLNLKKLYIRGGKFSDLGQYQACNLEEICTWKVETLSLKYLFEIELEWRQLQELFPDLVYLEQVSCPKLTFVPCDANGLWINETKPNASQGFVS